MHRLGRLYSEDKNCIAAGFKRLNCDCPDLSISTRLQRTFVLNASEECVWCRVLTWASVFCVLVLNPDAINKSVVRSPIVFILYIVMYVQESQTGTVVCCFKSVVKVGSRSLGDNIRAQLFVKVGSSKCQQSLGLELWVQELFFKKEKQYTEHLHSLTVMNWAIVPSGV